MFVFSDINKTVQNVQNVLQVGTDIQLASVHICPMFQIVKGLKIQCFFVKIVKKSVKKPFKRKQCFLKKDMAGNFLTRRVQKTVAELS